MVYSLYDLNIASFSYFLDVIIVLLILLLKYRRDNQSIDNNLFQMILISLDNIIFLIFRHIGKETSFIFTLFIFFLNLNNNITYLRLQKYLTSYFLYFRIVFIITNYIFLCINSIFNRGTKGIFEVAFNDIITRLEYEQIVIWFLYYYIHGGYKNNKILINVYYIT